MKPFIISMGGETYREVLRTERDNAPNLLRISDFCLGSDAIPDYDRFAEIVQSAEKKTCVLGLGEFLALRGQTEAEAKLMEIIRNWSCEAEVRILLRGFQDVLRRAAVADIRFGSNRYRIEDESGSLPDCAFVPFHMNIGQYHGLQAFLRAMEDGELSNPAWVDSDLIFPDALFYIKHIESAYDIACLRDEKLCAVAASNGSEAFWQKLYDDMESDGFSKVMEKHRADGDAAARSPLMAAGTAYTDWLLYISLKIKTPALPAGYLQYVLQSTQTHEAFLGKLIAAILDIPFSDKRFPAFYEERKRYLTGVSDAEIAGFIALNRRNGAVAIHYLTDNTLAERKAVIAFIAEQKELPKSEVLQTVYPALEMYIRHGAFYAAGAQESLLSRYFADYRRQKLINQMEDAFYEQVLTLGAPSNRPYNSMMSREEILQHIPTDNAFLFWVDALGIEYMGYLQGSCEKFGLQVETHTAAALLPTVTEINKGFYEKWNPKQRRKFRELDDTKHNDDGGYDYQSMKLPVYLASELDILRTAIENAAQLLKGYQADSVLIVGDHGASRLAVIKEEEVPFPSDEKGEHSGRCCKYYEGMTYANAAEENGYWVITDYGRFKGSRAANVEVHGGASLEEVCVPVLVLRRKDSAVEVFIKTPSVKPGRRKPAKLELFYPLADRSIHVIVNGETYTALADETDKTRYFVTLDQVTAAGTYHAQFFVDGAPAGSGAFTVEAAGFTENKLF
ncbi:MAG: BREX-4 system phosphatase PglZ [Oscillospiraceae bacterium]|jgi:hypothetical protein|nr:BREX-4 system phosphatase PglZ [Oscillospiraceae bacterium]